MESANPSNSAAPALNQPWYAQGVQFSCVPGCRRCCGGAPGYVWMDEKEIAALAAHMKLSVEDFERQYMKDFPRGPGGKRSLREKSNYECILLDEKGCSVYAARPRQCREYPFWPELLAAAADWEKERERCPGIGSGEYHSAPKLIEMLKARKAQAGTK